MPRAIKRLERGRREPRAIHNPSAPSSHHEFASGRSRSSAPTRPGRAGRARGQAQAAPAARFAARKRVRAGSKRWKGTAASSVMPNATRSQSARVSRKPGVQSIPCHVNVCARSRRSGPSVIDAPSIGFAPGSCAWIAAAMLDWRARRPSTSLMLPRVVMLPASMPANRKIQATLPSAPRRPGMVSKKIAHAEVSASAGKRRRSAARHSARARPAPFLRAEAGSRRRPRRARRPSPRARRSG